MKRRWFLPEAPDVIGMLREQAAITVEGLDALVAWAQGDARAADRVRECEHRADDAKRALREALVAAFATPLEPEDVFELSRGLDEVLNSAKNTVREAEVMHTGPDSAIAEMARDLADGTTALAGPSNRSSTATERRRQRPTGRSRVNGTSSTSTVVRCPH